MTGDCLERATHAVVVERCRELRCRTAFAHRAARRRVLTG
jgi:hypothetical protein